MVARTVSQVQAARKRESETLAAERAAHDRLEGNLTDVRTAKVREGSIRPKRESDPATTRLEDEQAAILAGDSKRLAELRAEKAANESTIAAGDGVERVLHAEHGRARFAAASATRTRAAVEAAELVPAINAKIGELNELMAPYVALRDEYHTASIKIDRSRNGDREDESATWPTIKRPLGL